MIAARSEEIIGGHPVSFQWFEGVASDIHLYDPGADWSC